MTDWNTDALFATMDRNPGASEAEIEQLTRIVGTRLPDDYLALMRLTNGAEGPIGVAGYLQLWTTRNVGPYNEGYKVERYAKGLLLIGTNGANAAYGIDTRPGDPNAMTYVETDLIGMGWDAIFFSGGSLRDLLHHIAYDE